MTPEEKEELHTRIAIEAMNGLLAGRRVAFTIGDAKEFAEKSIIIANVMLAELNKRHF